MQSQLLCPICRAPLARGEHTYLCPAHHSFDCAKSGYVNLLPSSTGGGHGDDRLMVRSRRDFLEKGYYQPLADAICSAAAEHCGDSPAVLDAGCGEGYYTARVAAALLSPRVIAVDVSRTAADLCARRLKDAEVAVASVYSLPIADACIDLVLNIFSPLAQDEYARVLRPNGLFLTVIPLEDHLYSLKAAVYDTPYRNRVKDTALPGFEFLGRRDVSYPITLTSKSDILALFCMTPYYYKTSARDQAKLNALNSLVTQASFALLLYRRIG